MTALLASVRDVAEAAVAVSAGCDWLDLKEPRAGALGAVDEDVIRAVVARYSGRLPISATIGDCWDTPALICPRVSGLVHTGVDYVKIGMYARRRSAELNAALVDAVAVMPKAIAVCFAEAPPTAGDLAHLAKIGFKGVMLDTAEKTQGSLTERMSSTAIAEFVTSALKLGLMTGLAGSLRVGDVPELLIHDSDYLGFRGALCVGGRREGTLDRAAIRHLRQLISGHATARLPTPAVN
ncbi:MAG: (5-formylfuran-3-yl)methyl phosphate synthase [Gammaproteobacteria bacterium]|nr:(5-formylfuran-3-yl)methyl phosphate synthase [Gammaproteobacteria bacterium]